MPLGPAPVERCGVARGTIASGATGTVRAAPWAPRRRRKAPARDGRRAVDAERGLASAERTARSVPFRVRTCHAGRRRRRRSASSRRRRRAGVGQNVSEAAGPGPSESGTCRAAARRRAARRFRLQPRLRWLVLYFVMNAIPIGIAALVLHVGRDLAATTSLRGRWTVRSDTPIPSDERCPPPPARTEEVRSFEIHQAGPDVTLRLERPHAAALRGRVRNGTLVARTDDVIVRARVVGHDDGSATRMVGTIRSARCPLVEVPFRAHRERDPH